MNHLFCASMKIEAMSKNPKALTWACMDASDESVFAFRALSVSFCLNEILRGEIETFPKKLKKESYFIKRKEI